MAHGKEIDVEYKEEIIDKINSFFGYNYVEKINLNLIPNEKTNNSQRFKKSVKKQL